MKKLADNPLKDNQEFSVEELKAMRLCACGSWKHARFSQCNYCYLLFPEPGKHARFIADLQRVKVGDAEYQILFQYLENELPQRKAVMLKLILAQKIKISKEDFIFYRKNVERRQSKRKNSFIAEDRRRIASILHSGPKVYMGLNTAP